MTHVTCRLTANNRDQLRNPTLGNRVWATFAFFTFGCTWRSLDVLNRKLSLEVAFPDVAVNLNPAF